VRCPVVPGTMISGAAGSEAVHACVCIYIYTHTHICVRVFSDLFGFDDSPILCMHVFMYACVRNLGCRSAASCFAIYIYIYIHV
jgi:hypothetical protein